MKKNLVVLSGAGMSAESGISTFRDAGGLWDQYPVEHSCWMCSPTRDTWAWPRWKRTST